MVFNVNDSFTANFPGESQRKNFFGSGTNRENGHLNIVCGGDSFTSASITMYSKHWLVLTFQIANATATERRDES